VNAAATERIHGPQGASYAARQPRVEVAWAGAVERQPIQRMYVPDALDLDLLADLLVELVNLPEVPAEPPCISGDTTRSCV